MPTDYPHLEIDASELTFEILEAMLVRYNCLVIRRFALPMLMERILQRALQVFEQRQQFAAAANPAKSHVSFIGIHELDLPGAPPHQILTMFAASKLKPLIQQLIGTPIYFNLAEAACRKILPQRPDLLVLFHQDGFFDLTPPWRHINCWLPLVPCGIDAPGIAVVPSGLQDMLSKPSADNSAVARYGFPECAAYVASHSDALWQPALNPGDVLIMNEFAVHGSFGTPTMTKTRYNLELRFVSGDIPDTLKQQYGLIEVG
ncbi:MAG: hypothetical protein ACAI44_32625 [Candidatus Sericytochromatia bacterium]